MMSETGARIHDIQATLEAHSQRWGRAPEILAVTKTVAPDQILSIRGSGITRLGENRVQELLQKRPQIDASFTFHLIGRLQTNKVKYIIDQVALIESLDRLSLAEEIDRRAQRANRRMPVLIQVNIGRERQKGGIPEEELLRFARDLTSYPGLCVQGLMAVMPESTDEQVLRPLFRRMRTLFEALRDAAFSGTEIRTLSMGMSGDYALAAEEGATQVRLGSAIFGARTPKQATDQQGRVFG